MTDTGTDRVTDFLNTHLKRSGRDKEAIARAIPQLKSRDVQEILRGHRRLPFEHVASFARELRADPLVLLQHCLAEYAPETYCEVEQRFDNSMTAEEQDVVNAMRNYADAAFLAGQTPLQRQKMRDWLSSLRAPTPSIH